MKSNGHLLLPWRGALKLLMGAFAVRAGVVLAASAPTQFTYQGQLVEIVNGVNVPVKSGTNDIFAVDMWLRLYSSVGAEKATGALYGRKVSVLVNKGIFSVDIGDESGTALSAAYTNLLSLISASDSSTLLVGITPFDDANDEISPRQPLFSAPYALLANDVSQALGDFTATNGTALFQALEVTGATVFKGAVTSLCPVAINGNVTFANGMTNTSSTVARKLTVDGTLQQSQGSTTINGSLSVLGDATVQAGGLTAASTTFRGNVTTPEVTALGTMAAGNLIASQIVATNVTCQSTLTVQGKALFGSYFPSSAWYGRDDGDVAEGTFTAPTDGIIVMSVILRRDNANGVGSLTFTLGGRTFLPRIVTTGSANGTDENTFTLLMKQGEVLSWGSEVSDAEDTPSRIEFRAFNGL